jgi:putative glutamine amidotransferase
VGTVNLLPLIGLTSSPDVLQDRPVETIERAYVDAVDRTGAMSVIVPVLDPSRAATLVEGLDGMVLAGGGDVHPSWYDAVASPNLGTVHAARDAWEIALARAGLARGLPMLGICRGAQVLNVALGGTLVQHLPEVSDLAHCVKDRCSAPVHTVRISEGSRVHAIVGTDVLGVNSLHHQAVERVGTGLAAVAWAEDGTVEAVEGSGTPS